MGNLHIVVAETMGTDGEFYTEVYPCKSDMDAFDTMCGLIEEMANTMDVDISDKHLDSIRELSGEGWWYRVKDVVVENFI